MALNDVLAEIGNHSNFLITSHQNPDGDSIGSQLAMRRILLAMGKNAVIANADPVPGAYRFLPDADCVSALEKVNAAEFTCALVLDASQLDRTCIPRGKLGDVDIINIDHHCDNGRFGKINWVEDQASSTAELVAALWQKAEKGEDSRIAAEQLYVGIFTDTGGFRFSNTNASSLAICADLVETGLRPSHIARMLYSQNSLARIRLRGIILSGAKLVCDGKVCLMELETSQIAKMGAVPEDTEGISDEAMQTRGAEAGIFIRYYEDRTKVNLRSAGRVDVGKIARQFGGGGHAEAAGCTLKVPGQVARQCVLESIEKALAGDPSISPG